ncbi:hypothetical protein F5J12DRAFT_760488 [Pisolithus orientalis]|uniref:uncharacterized protein n=1 Tax=Pisolithus orientalis TaxID=936130 RepID=UPI0022254919|nr:uncharacterized protein F5J12DRAFT_760488 [Pisolithus orientalis]KAI6035470.1 hypothetical protein F5J12DRAFT_760488 [Pisolithus orientalis]
MPALDANPSSGRNIRQQHPAITTFAVLATFLTPFTIIPYVFINRRMTHLSRQLEQWAASTNVMQRNLQTLAREAALRKELDVVRNELLLLRQNSEYHRTRTELSDVAIRADLLKHSSELRQTREHLYSVLPQLGLSLANIAEFMHEVQLSMGMTSAADKHGIERLRDLALRLYKPPHSNTPLSNPQDDI